MARFHTLLREYERFHDRPANRVLHALGTPPILLALLVTLLGLPLPGGVWPDHLNAASAALILALVGYVRLSPRVAFGAALALGGLYAAAFAMRELPAATQALIASALFVGGWALMLWGHALQGAHPRLLREPVFALVGTSALICRVYDRLGIRY